MIKKDFDNKFQELIDLYETNDVLTLDERIKRLTDVVEFGREYNQKYKVPFKRQFMGKPIKYTEKILVALEEIIEQGKQVRDNING